MEAKQETGGHDLAYLFGRFPSFDKTFCAREVLGLRRLDVRPLVFSIRDARDEEIRHYPASLYDETVYMPERAMLRRRTGRFSGSGLPAGARRLLREHKGRHDSARLFEAAFVGTRMARHAVSHVHAHFMGMAARTAWWIHRMFGYTFSVSAHANDLFCDTGFEVSHERVIEATSALIVESDYAKRWAERRYPQVRSKVFAVHNGLDVAEIAAHTGAAAERDEPPLIVCVGRMVEKKGYPVLLDACALLRERGVAFRCVVIGDGPLREAIGTQLEAQRLGDRVELLGAQSQQRILETLSRARAFVLACVEEQDGGQDNLPTAIAEAMAAGLPCVSTAVAGIPEMIVEGRTGFVVQPGAPEPLAAALGRLLESPSLARALGEAGRLRARQRFDQSATSRELWRVLEPHCRG